MCGPGCAGILEVVNLRRLLISAVAAVTAVVAGWAISGLVRPPEPTTVRPIVLDAGDRGSDEGKGGGKAPPEEAEGDSNGAQPAPPPPPPPAGDDDDFDDGDDGDDTGDDD